MTWIDALGWLGSALLIFSLMQARVLRFRILNTVASVVLVAFNAVLGIWSMVAMNGALTLINLWFIGRLVADRHDESAYSALEVGPDDAYLHHLLRVHRGDIAKNQPDLDWDGTRPGARAYIVQRRDETVGLVLAHEHDGVLQVELDYVTPRFRDFRPGEFVWRHSEVLRDRGLRRVVSPPGMTRPYYDRIGFRREGAAYVLDL